MKNYKGAFSQIKTCGGVPALYVNGKAFTSVAYMTYFEQFNNYKGFAEKGYDFFSVPVLFSGRWINSTSDTPAFKKGIYDNKDSPNFSLFDESIEKILEQCPDANIFPRVNMSMPEWWEKENPYDVNINADGASCRESMYSSKWREDVSALLKQFVKYVNNSKYASHIVGYQIAGGNTEEWFHFDMNAGYCKNAERGFEKYLKKCYPGTEYKGLPDLSNLNIRASFHNDEYLSEYLEFASVSVADAISHFASIVKSETGNNVVVGTFYGYSLEVKSSLYGTHALKVLLDDKNIDFICSPCSYLETRNPEADWTEMFPADSLRLHGKMCFQECDIRTNLTTLICEKDISLDPNKVYTAPIWKGPNTREESISHIRKAFCRQLIKGNGLWWFDMWGGWFDDDDILNEMKRFRNIYSESLTKNNRRSLSEIAVFVDEGAYKYMTNSFGFSISSQRKVLGLMGTPYDIYDVSDFDTVKDNYLAVVFLSPIKTRYMKNAVSFCTKNKVPFLIPDENQNSFSVKELRSFCKNNSIKIYCETDDILYIGNNYAALYSLSEGEKEIKLFSQKKIMELIPEEKDYAASDVIKISMTKGEIALFEFC